MAKPPTFTLYENDPVRYRIELDGLPVRHKRMVEALPAIADDCLVRLGRHLYMGPTGRPMTEEAPGLAASLDEARAAEEEELGNRQ